MPRPSECVLVCGPWRVVFARRDDRWAHRIERCSPENEENVLPIFESVEGTCDDAILASPPLQEVQVQRLPSGRDVALGVGMAGRNHWSVTFAPACGPLERPEDGWIAVEVACRLRERVPQLRSTYRCIPPVHVSRTESRIVELSGCEPRIRIHSEETFEATPDGFAIVADVQAAKTTPFTRTLTYGIGNR